MIEMVQHTDLAKHFDFITRLKTLAASKVRLGLIG